MRAGLSTIQQTLTPEASAVLNHSIAEAARRNHGQTTPLHVAATLLSSPSGFLRGACVKSHPNSSHPLQCRALELCFSVALDRLPANPSGGGGANPPISNALMAALKRAQAHQRRGCPDQQQQPLLAVKVELEQLVVSILDDPSVSRVMREASFSSPAVKATIEQSMTATAATSSSTPSTASPTTAATTATNSTPVGVSGKLGLLGARQIPTPLIPGNRNLYLNPRLQQQQQQKSGSGLRLGGKEEEVKKVLDILKRAKKRNPVLVADPEPATLVREVVESIEKGIEGPKNVEVISVEEDFVSDRSQIVAKIKELGNSIEKRLLHREGVVLHLGDLKWLVEGPNGLNSGQTQPPAPPQQIVSEIGRSVVAEMARLISRFAEDGAAGRRLWVIGSASCATYLRCQVYHPTMESDWDLQAVPIAARAPVPGMFPRTGNNGILNSTVESPAPAGKGLSPIPATTTLLPRRPSEIKPSSITTICSVCDENYRKELAKLVAEDLEKSSSNSMPEARQKALPQWLQAAKLSTESSTTEQHQAKEQGKRLKQSTEELLDRWKATCSRLHPNPSPLLHQGLQQTKASSLVQSSSIPKPTLAMNGPGRRVTTPPGSPVRTDLVLGRPKDSETSILESRIKDSGGCALDFFPSQREKLCGQSDSDSFKRLLKGLAEKVAWQAEAASAVAVTVHQCQSGNEKRRASGTRGDTWLLLMGPDKVGKRKLASALSELVFGASSVSVSFGRTKLGGEENGRRRGRTAIDQVAEAVRRNPFAVFVLEDVDHADVLVRSSLKRAIERGRLPDSHGREVSLTSSIFVITAESLPGGLRTEGMESLIQCEEKLESAANSGWQLELMVGDRTVKRKAEWLREEGRLSERRKEPGTGLSLDLNLAVGDVEEENGEGSSDLTAEHEHEHEHEQQEQEYGRGHGPGKLVGIASGQASPSPLLELIDAVDNTVVFKPVDFSTLQRKLSDAVVGKFNSVMGGRGLLRLDGEALDRIVGGIWFKGGAEVFDEWTERVLAPCFAKLKGNLPGDDASTIVKLLPVKDGGSPESAALPSRIIVSGVEVSER